MHTEWIILARKALRLDTYRPDGTAAQICRECMMRDLERLCPDAWRAVVRG